MQLVQYLKYLRHYVKLFEDFAVNKFLHTLLEACEAAIAVTRIQIIFKKKVGWCRGRPDMSQMPYGNEGYIYKFWSRFFQNKKEVFFGEIPLATMSCKELPEVPKHQAA